VKPTDDQNFKAPQEHESETHIKRRERERKDKCKEWGYVKEIQVGGRRKLDSWDYLEVGARRKRENGGQVTVRKRRGGAFVYYPQKKGRRNQVTRRAPRKSRFVMASASSITSPWKGRG